MARKQPQKKPNEKWAKPKKTTTATKRKAPKPKTIDSVKNVPATQPKTQVGSGGGGGKKPPSTRVASGMQDPRGKGVAKRRAPRVEKEVKGTTIRDTPKALSGPKGSASAPMGAGRLAARAIPYVGAALTAYSILQATTEKRPSSPGQMGRGKPKAAAAAKPAPVATGRRNKPIKRVAKAAPAAATQAATQAPAKAVGSATKPMGGSSSFGSAFKAARDAKKETFSFKGDSYAAVTADEVKASGAKNLRDFLNLKRKRKERKESTPSVITKIR